MLLKCWVYKHSLSELEMLYRMKLAINKNRLEKASLEQATEFEKWYDAFEVVDADLKELKFLYNRKRSELELKIRRSYPDLKEGGIRAKLDISSILIKKMKKLHKIERYHRKLKGAVEAVKVRKSMISILKDLYISNYWDKTTSKGTPIHPRRKQK